MSARFPPAQADQVLCKQNQLRMLKERQAKWFQQRAAEERRVAGGDEGGSSAAGEDASLQTHGALPVPAAPSGGSTWSTAEERWAQRQLLSELRQERAAVKQTLQGMAVERTVQRHAERQEGMLLPDAAVGTSGGVTASNDLLPGASGVGELPQRAQERREEEAAEEEEEEAQMQRALRQSLLDVAPGCRESDGGGGGGGNDGLYRATSEPLGQSRREHTDRGMVRAASHLERIEQQRSVPPSGGKEDEDGDEDGDELRDLDLELEQMGDFLLAVRLAADEEDV